MTVAVVEVLEPVDIDHEDADRVVGSAAPSQQPAELVEVAPVRQPGQGIDRGMDLRGAMRVRPRQRRRRLAGGAVEQPAGGGRPRIRHPPREHDRADDRVVGHERRGDRVAQAVGTADPRGDALGDLLRAVRATPDVGRDRRGRQRHGLGFAELRDGTMGAMTGTGPGIATRDGRDGLGLDRDRDRFGLDELPVGGPLDPLHEIRDRQDRRRVGDAGPGAHEGRVEDPRARAPARHHDMIGARRLARAP